MALGHFAEIRSKVGPTGVSSGANSDVRDDQEKGVSPIAILGLSARCHNGEETIRTVLTLRPRRDECAGPVRA